MKNLIVSFMIVAAFALTAFAQEQTQDKKQAQEKKQVQVQDKKQTKDQNQVRTQENKELKEQTKLQTQEQKREHKYNDIDGDGLDDATAKKMTKDGKSNPNSEVGHGEGAGAMKRPRDRDQDGKMEPGSGQGPKGDAPHSQKGSRKGQKD